MTDMTEEMKKLRDKMAEENANKFYHAQGDITQVMPWSDCKESFINGFDACYKEMQAQVDEFKREEIARQKTFALGHTEIYICSLEEQLKSKDAQVDQLKIYLTNYQNDMIEKNKQVDELMKSNKEMSDLIYSEDGYISSQESLIKERDTLKQQLEVLEKNKKAMNSLIGLHSMKIDALEDQIKQREIAYDSAVKELRIHKDAQLETLLKDKKNE